MADQPDHSLVHAPVENFRKAVDEDVRGLADPAVAAALRLEGCSHRWLTELRRLKSSLDSQRAAKKAEARASAIELRLAGDEEGAECCWAEYWRWFAGSARFGSAVDDKLAEAKVLRPRCGPTSSSDRGTPSRSAWCGR